MTAIARLNPPTYPQPLNALERAGWAVLAAEMFGVRSGEAAALRELVLSPGRVVSNETLQSCFAPHEHRRQSRPVAMRMAVRIARIRAALEDIGLPRCAVINERELGYVVPVHHARRIRQIVEGAR